MEVSIGKSPVSDHFPARHVWLPEGDLSWSSLEWFCRSSSLSLPFFRSRLPWWLRRRIRRFQRCRCHHSQAFPHGCGDWKITWTLNTCRNRLYNKRWIISILRPEKQTGPRPIDIHHLYPIPFPQQIKVRKLAYQLLARPFEICKLAKEQCRMQNLIVSIHS